MTRLLSSSALYSLYGYYFSFRKKIGVCLCVLVLEEVYTHSLYRRGFVEVCGAICRCQRLVLRCRWSTRFSVINLNQQVNVKEGIW